MSSSVDLVIIKQPVIKGPHGYIVKIDPKIMVSMVIGSRGRVLYKG
jgi:hypothetical protein